MALVRCFQRKREPEGRFGAKTRPEQANPSAGFRKGEIARRGPQTPRETQKRPRLRALRNVERSFHLTTMVEGMLLSSKLLFIGRGSEFAAGSNPLGNAGIETLASNGRSHRGTDLIPALQSPMLQEPAQPAQSPKRSLGRSRMASAEAGCGRLADAVARPAHGTGPRAEGRASLRTAGRRERSAVMMRGRRERCVGPRPTPTVTLRWSGRRNPLPQQCRRFWRHA